MQNMWSLTPLGVTSTGHNSIDPKLFAGADVVLILINLNRRLFGYDAEEIDPAN